MHNESKTAGILSIISGAFGILSLLFIILGCVMIYFLSQNSDMYGIYPSEVMTIMYLMYAWV